MFYYKPVILFKDRLEALLDQFNYFHVFLMMELIVSYDRVSENLFLKKAPFYTPRMDPRKR